MRYRNDFIISHHHLLHHASLHSLLLQELNTSLLFTHLPNYTLDHYLERRTQPLFTETTSFLAKVAGEDFYDIWTLIFERWNPDAHQTLREEKRFAARLLQDPETQAEIERQIEVGPLFEKLYLAGQWTIIHQKIKDGVNLRKCNPESKPTSCDSDDFGGLFDDEWTINEDARQHNSHQ